ncbi:hypothetical protein CH252_09030 [Rhodococcus sp. 06-1477-1B]|nr:hypothetical protein CH252_09030 [Rhodococcus sp. 06-1477-1B]
MSLWSGDKKSHSRLSIASPLPRDSATTAAGGRGGETHATSTTETIISRITRASTEVSEGRCGTSAWWQGCLAKCPFYRILARCPPRFHQGLAPA